MSSGVPRTPGAAYQLFLWLMECLPGLPPLCWSMIPTAQAPQLLERPLHMVEAAGTVRLQQQIQLPLQKQCCSQVPFQLLGACCPLRSAGWASACVRRSSEFKLFRHQLSVSKDLSPGTAICPAEVGSCSTRWWLQPPSSSLSTYQLSKVCHTFPRSRNQDALGL